MGESVIVTRWLHSSDDDVMDDNSIVYSHHMSDFRINSCSPPFLHMDDWMNGDIWIDDSSGSNDWNQMIAAARNPRLRNLRVIFGLGGFRHRGPRGGP